jgi:hypothetical protein
MEVEDVVVGLRDDEEDVDVVVGLVAAGFQRRIAVRPAATRQANRRITHKYSTKSTSWSSLSTWSDSCSWTSW